MPFHPLAKLFPLLVGPEFAELVEDLKRNGLREPIRTLEGKILDGRNRYRACKEAGVKPRFLELNGDGPPLEYVLSVNLRRRHLNESQRAMVGARLKPLFEEEARQRKLSGKRADLSANLRQGRSSESAAALASVSARSVETATAVLKRGASELIELVESGKVAVDQAGYLAKLPKREQKDIIAKGKSEIAFAAKRVQNQLREKRGEENFSRFYKKVQPLKELGRYSVILADPPWPYEHSESFSRDPQSRYPTMSLEEICNLPVFDHCTEDAWLYLWAPPPKCMEAGGVITAWGFTYRSKAIWEKDRIGMGYIFRQKHEDLLAASRGNPPHPLPKNRHTSVFKAPRGLHSQKPEAAYEMIEKMHPGLPKLELFARKPREGWDCWGNEV